MCRLFQLDYRAYYRERDSNPHWPVFETGASANWTTPALVRQDGFEPPCLPDVFYRHAQSATLPLALIPGVGFEPTTSWPSTMRLYQLDYPGVWYP